MIQAEIIVILNFPSRVIFYVLPDVQNHFCWMKGLIERTSLADDLIQTRKTKLPLLFVLRSGKACMKSAAKF